MAIRARYPLGDSLGIDNLMSRAESNKIADIRLYLEAGLIYSQWNDFSRAEYYLNKAIKGEPASIETDDEAFGYSTAFELTAKTRARAAYQLGYIYGRQGQLNRSIEMSRRAIALDSTLAEAYINLYNGLMLQNRDIAGAHSIIKEAFRRFPENQTIRKLHNQR